MVPHSRKAKLPINWKSTDREHGRLVSCSELTCAQEARLVQGTIIHHHFVYRSQRRSVERDSHMGETQSLIAIIHYSPDPETCAVIKKDQVG